MTASSSPVAAAPTPKAQGPGDLPEWNLDDLYPGPQSRELADDFARAEREVAAFAGNGAASWRTWRTSPTAATRWAAPWKPTSDLSDLLGRIASYAMLYYVGDTDDPERSKFFGDMQGRLTDISLQLLFFELEFNRIDDAVMERALAAPRLAHYRPWVADLRKERPHQLDDRIEELFHEKSLTGAAAWNRLFDETMSALRFTVEGEELSLEPTLKLLLDHDETKRQAAAEALRKRSAPTCACSR
jgi:oligoendopeptidase F